jgi:hypothetical protein
MSVTTAEVRQIQRIVSGETSYVECFGEFLNVEAFFKEVRLHFETIRSEWAERLGFIALTVYRSKRPVTPDYAEHCKLASRKYGIRCQVTSE